MKNINVLRWIFATILLASLGLFLLCWPEGKINVKPGLNSGRWVLKSATKATGQTEKKVVSWNGKDSLILTTDTSNAGSAKTTGKYWLIRYQDDKHGIVRDGADSRRFLTYGLLILPVLCSLAGLFFLKENQLMDLDPVTASSNLHQPRATQDVHAEKESDQPTGSEILENTVSGLEDNSGQIETRRAMQEYLAHFYQCYQNFYGDIQKMPADPSREQRQQIKRGLVEMGLHTLSFARAARLNKLHRKNDEPNIRLIVDHLSLRQLEKQTYRMYTDDPYQTEKRYHILRKVFQEMDLDHLNVLVETVYIGTEFIKLNDL